MFRPAKPGRARAGSLASRIEGRDRPAERGWCRRPGFLHPAGVDCRTRAVPNCHRRAGFALGSQTHGGPPRRIGPGETAFHASSARMAWAVRSTPLRSNGSLPQPRQKVGQPPSEFCRPEQPSHARFGRRVEPGHLLLHSPRVVWHGQRQQGAGGVVGVGDRAAQVGPPPSARGGIGERVDVAVLAR